MGWGLRQLSGVQNVFKHFQVISFGRLKLEQDVFFDKFPVHDFLAAFTVQEFFGHCPTLSPVIKIIMDCPHRLPALASAES